jgi:hypothetical protein
MDSINTANPTSDPTSNVIMHEDSSNQNSINTVNPMVVMEKKKRGRKKTIKPDVVLSSDDMATSADTATATATATATDTATAVTEKKIRKRRTKKNMNATDATDANDANDTTDATDVVSGVKVRKRRVCKSKSTDINMGTNVIIDSNNPDAQIHPVEEKVVKKRGRKPKGGKIITQKLEENNNNNEIPNIILHLKCSLSDIKNSDKLNCNGVEESQIESYNNSSQLKGSDIFVKNAQPNMESKKLPNTTTTTTTTTSSTASVPAYNDSLSHLFKVYNPDIASTNGDVTGNKNSNVFITHSASSIPSCSSNEILNNRAGMFNSVYSPDINLYGNNDYDDGDDGDSITGTCKNEKEIWRKINQLKISFHKSDICKNIGGTQRSACFWCTCEFDSPAIYIPKSLTKDVYNVYGCFCSPECSAAFLMNENVDTSTKFERYHLLNLLYGKIYKYEKSIKIAPNPFYLLNKFYGNLTIQEYRKLFQSDQMIYIVNKPLTHILPELYEDNNDFLLNSKIIPTNSVNIKKNKPLKSNIINSAFGITAGGK